MNKTFRYGPNVVGRGCCYHPHNGQGWLRDNGCHVEKAGGIEIYDTEGYVNDRTLWGAGGVMLHELAHSYHNQHVKNGYGNKEILNVC